MAKSSGNFVFLFLLFLLLGVSSYVLWEIYPQINAKDVTFFSNGSGTFGQIGGGVIFEISNGTQFYSNMRYKDKEISYWIEPACSDAKRQEMQDAFITLSQKSILRFVSSPQNDAEISVVCSELAPDAEEKGHFIAGEGGPSKIINTTLYAIILTGKISLFREDTCKTPQIAIHELLHALGFDHNRDPMSIMYPVTNCNQKIDDYLIKELNGLYSQENLPDLYVKSASATKTGRYMNFQVTVQNQGLIDSGSAVLEVYSGQDLVKTFSLESLSIGTSKTLSVENLRIDPATVSISFVVKADKEISLANNRADMMISTTT